MSETRCAARGNNSNSALNTVGFVIKASASRNESCWLTADRNPLITSLTRASSASLNLLRSGLSAALKVTLETLPLSRSDGVKLKQWPLSIRVHLVKHCPERCFFFRFITRHLLYIQQQFIWNRTLLGIDIRKEFNFLRFGQSVVNDNWDAKRSLGHCIPINSMLTV